MLHRNGHLGKVSGRVLAYLVLSILTYLQSLKTYSSYNYDPCLNLPFQSFSISLLVVDCNNFSLLIIMQATFGCRCEEILPNAPSW